ncbi:MAG: hypothetical protein RLZZ158_184 [Cyanobacteriota bacterium]
MTAQPPPPSKPQAWGPKARLAAINLAVLALLLSPLLGPWLLAHWALGHPRWAGGPLLDLARWPYLNIYRQGIQGRKDCFQRDKTLTYIGQPNANCRFDNLEFRTTQQFNSLGVRDSEAALRQPRSIVIGDSHAMGWGVEAGERYSQLLGAPLQPSLNLAIASYGTARELRLLERYARRYPRGYAGARTILLQYGVNDWGENSSTGKQRFQSSSYRSYAANTPYVKPELLLDPWNAAHLRLFTEHWLKGLLKPEANPLDVPYPNHGEAFVASFSPYQQLLAGKSLVVFVSSDYGLWNASVYRDLKHSLGNLQRQLPRTRVVLLDLSEACDSSCYFRLDDHLTAEGHRRVAQWLNQSLPAPLKPAPATR